MEIDPPHSSARSFKEFLLQLFAITVGVLIALSLEGLLEWNHYRRLVREAKETISLEIADNKRGVDGQLAALDARRKELDDSLRFADQLLSSRKTIVEKIGVSGSLTILSTAGWHSAERTGALSHMKYSEVKQYAELYSLQELYAEQQRRTWAPYAGTLAAITVYRETGDPSLVPRPDLEAFRQHTLALGASLVQEEQLGRPLVKA